MAKDFLQFSCVFLVLIMRLVATDALYNAARYFVASGCVDKNTYCKTWSSQGFCSHASYTKTMRRDCPRSCNFCAVNSPCIDKHYNCRSWASTGECRKNPQYMLKTCKKSCNVCNKPVATKKPITKPVRPQSCVDKDSRCKGWTNYCSIKAHLTFMTANCPGTCKLCCKDKHTSCPSWANTGECSKNPAYMSQNCKKSCNLCGGMPVTTKTPRTKPATASPKPQIKCGKRSPGFGRIVGGKNASSGHWPWHVAISERTKSSTPPFCAGTLISHEWVVTAAHCIKGRVGPLYAILGDTDLKRVSGHEVVVRVDLKDIYVHQNYELNAAYDFDIALLHLKSRVQFTDYIRPACLPESFPRLPVNTLCTVTGFGRTSEGGYKSSWLMEATVPLVSAAACSKALVPQIVTSNMLCAGYKQGNIDACQADSGGPLVCLRSDNSWQLTGIVSWGIGCARANKPGVYSDVQVLQNWVNKTIHANSNASG